MFRTIPTKIIFGIVLIFSILYYIKNRSREEYNARSWYCQPGNLPGFDITAQSARNLADCKNQASRAGAILFVYERRKRRYGKHGLGSRSTKKCWLKSRQGYNSHPSPAEPWLAPEKEYQTCRVLPGAIPGHENVI